MSFWLALALAIIVGGGFAILRRLRLLEIAVTLLGHVRRLDRRARGERPRHDGALAPRPGLGLALLAGARLLARDPRLPLLHDHRPEDDPRGQGRPPGLRGRDRAARGAADRAADDRVRREGRRARPRSRSSAPRGPSLESGRAPALARRVWSTRAPSARPRSPVRSRSSSLLVVAGIPARSSARRASCPRPSGAPPDVSVRTATGIAPIDRRTAERIALDLVADLENESEALRRRDRARATAGADGARLAGLWRQIDAARAARSPSRATRVERVRVSLEPAEGQSPPLVVATRVGNGRARRGRRSSSPRRSSSSSRTAAT